MLLALMVNVLAKTRSTDLQVAVFAKWKCQSHCFHNYDRMSLWDEDDAEISEKKTNNIISSVGSCQVSVQMRFKQILATGQYLEFISADLAAVV